MKKKALRAAALIAAALSLFSLAGCATPSYEGFVYPDKKPSTLAYNKTEGWYIKRSPESLKPAAEKTLEVFTSDDGLCKIEKKKSYYDVTLDYEKGTPKEIGAAYAQAIKKACPTYTKIIENYLFENIRAAFQANIDNSALSERLLTLKNSLSDDYQQEIEGFAQEITNGEMGIKENDKISYEEVVLINILPDALRPNQCSTMTISGSKSATGHRITSRNLEWNLGSSNQICDGHCVVHFKNGEKSFTSVSFLGMFDVLTAVNDSGVMLGTLDVGSLYSSPFVAEGRTCYSFAYRYVMENCNSAKEAAQYLAEHSPEFTFNSNAFITDDKDAYCVEMVVSEQDGTPLVRDSSTELHDGLTWDDPECLCAVNSFAAKGNSDMLTISNGNYVRWKKYNHLFCEEKQKITLSRYLELLTCEKVEDSPVVNIRNNNLVHTVIADYDSHRLIALMTSKDGVKDEVSFIDLGSF